MSIRSELVEIQIIDNSGKAETFYTYDGYYAEQERHKIRKYRRQVEKRTFTSASILGFLAYYTSRKTHLSEIHLRSYRIPTKGLLSGVLGFVGGLLLFDFVGTQQIADFERNVALNSRHLPLWKSKRAAVNPDRAFFELIDSSNNQLSIFHSGLTAETAVHLIPDKIIGTVPEKPHDPKLAH